MDSLGRTFRLRDFVSKRSRSLVVYTGSRGSLTWFIIGESLQILGAMWRWHAAWSEVRDGWLNGRLLCLDNSANLRVQKRGHVYDVDRQDASNEVAVEQSGVLGRMLGFGEGCLSYRRCTDWELVHCRAWDQSMALLLSFCAESPPDCSKAGGESFSPYPGVAG